MLCKDAARVVKVETSDAMIVICDRKRFGEVPQMFGCLEDEHAVTELLEQQGHARALGGQVACVMRQYVQAIGGVGKQEMSQGLVACLCVEAQTVKVLLEKIQVAPRETAQCIECRVVVFCSIQLGVLQGSHVYPRCFFPGTRYPSTYHG